MAETPDNQVTPEAPTPGASASIPEVKVTPGGKARPSVAGAKRVRPTVNPTVSSSVPTVELPTEGAETQEAPAAEAMEGEGVPSTFDSAEDVRNRASVKKRKKLSKAGVVAIVIMSIAVLLLCIASAMRWLIPQDGADIQGAWTMNDAKNSVVIANGQIDLAGEAQYDYSLDSTAKTIDVGFFTQEGRAHYRFSPDRQSLAIIECDDYGWMSTLMNDLAWQWDDLVANLQGNPHDALGSDSGIVLHRA